MKRKMIGTALAGLVIMSLLGAAAVSATNQADTGGVAINESASQQISAKQDRLPTLTTVNVDYVTVETRLDGVSMLSRIAVTK